MDPAHDTCSDQYVDVSTIFICVVPAIETQILTIYNIGIDDTRALQTWNMERTEVQYGWHHLTWIFWEPVLPPIIKFHWEYSLIDRFSHYIMSKSILLVQLLYVCNITAWYLGELLHPQKSREELTPPVDFIMASSDMLIHTYIVSHIVFYFPVGLNIDVSFWSIQVDAYDKFFIHLPGAIRPTEPWSSGSSKSDIAIAIPYSSINYSTTDLLFSA